MSDRSTVSVELSSDQLAFLEQMVKQYQLPDLGKAIRCMANHAMQTPENLGPIFKEIRCTGCG